MESKYSETMQHPAFILNLRLLLYLPTYTRVAHQVISQLWYGFRQTMSVCQSPRMMRGHSSAPIILHRFVLTFNMLLILTLFFTKSILFSSFWCLFLFAFDQQYIFRVMLRRCLKITWRGRSLNVSSCNVELGCSTSEKVFWKGFGEKFYFNDCLFCNGLKRCPFLNIFFDYIN